MAPILQVTDITKQFTSDVKVLKGINFDVDHGEIVALLGESGCGKTTLLRIIAGFESPNQGEMQMEGQVVVSAKKSTKPQDRNVGMVFQDYALFPHLTVAKNLAFGVEKKDRALVTDQIAQLLSLQELLERFPFELSGGQQQRVALGRALAPKPKLLLLDEPFSNLDQALKGNLRREIRAILKKAGSSAIMVTHDKEDAFAVADKIVLMKDGQVAQCGSPSELYHQPINRYVAGYFGAVNVFHTHDKTQPFFDLFQTENTIPKELVIRPNSIQVSSTINQLQEGVSLPATFISEQFMGNETRRVYDCGGQEILVDISVVEGKYKPQEDTILFFPKALFFKYI